MNLPFTFVYPWVLLFSLAVIPMVFFMSRRQNAVGHSSVDLAKGLRKLNFIAWISTGLLAVAWVAGCIAAAQPQLAESKETQTREVRDIVVIMDISGSMSATVEGENPNTDGKPYRRIDAAKDAVCNFVARREGDRVAVLLFDDDSYYSWPLTTDIKMLLKRCQRLNSHLGGGTNFQGPEQSQPGIGAIQAPLNHLKEFGKAKTKVIVIVTDGEAPITDERFQKLAEQVEQQGARLYVLGVGHEWTSGAANPSTEPLRNFVDRVGGKVFAANDKAAFERAVAEIDSLEKSKIEIEKTVTYKDIYQYFLYASLLTWLLYLVGISITREST